MEFIDYSIEKVKGCGDIVHSTETYQRLRNGKVHKEKQSWRDVVERLCLSYKYINERVKKVPQDEALEVEQQKPADRRKHIAEETKTVREALHSK